MRLSWKTRLGIGLIISSALVYFVHYLIFKDLHHIFLYMIGDIAFLPIEVLLVTIIIHHLLGQREKRVRLEKMNMVIGAFFSEVGTKLLAYLSDFDPELDKIRKDLLVSDDWTDKEFKCMDSCLQNYDYNVDIKEIKLEDMKTFLGEKRDFLLRMLENQNLLEHESFTDLLHAVFHLTEELSYRQDLKDLTDADCEHIEGDVKRIYNLLAQEWVDYMRYLKKSYPYFFSLAMRTNPFDQEATPIVK